MESHISTNRDRILNRLIYCDRCNTPMYARRDYIQCEASWCETTFCNSCRKNDIGYECNECYNVDTPPQKVTPTKCGQVDLLNLKPQEWNSLFEKVKMDKCGYYLFYCSGCKKAKFSLDVPIVCESLDCDVVSCEDCRDNVFPVKDVDVCKECQHN